MFRALIIEDNPGARAELRELLSHHDNVTIIGEAPTVGRARTLLALDDYDLVFLDIELRGGNGFDLVPHVRSASRIIFVTAFNDYAIRAFEVNALDYLLKPVDPDRLAQSLARLDTNSIDASGTLNTDDLVHLSTDSGAQFVPAADIAAIVAEQNYTRVHLIDGSKYFIRRALKNWEEQLAPQILRRVARDALINLRHVTGTSGAHERTGTLSLSGVNEPIAVSAPNWPAVQILIDRQE